MGESTSKSDRKQAAAHSANKERYENTTFGRRPIKRNRAVAVVVSIAVAVAVPFVYLVKRLKRN